MCRCGCVIVRVSEHNEDGNKWKEKGEGLVCVRECKEEEQGCVCVCVCVCVCELMSTKPRYITIK